MAEMKISNTLVNDTSTGVIAYAEQIIDRGKAYPELSLGSNPTLTAVIGKLAQLRRDFDTLVGNEENIEGVIDTFTEIKDFLNGIPEDSTLDSIISPLFLGTMNLNLDNTTGVLSVEVATDKVTVDGESGIDPVTGKINIIVTY